MDVSEGTCGRDGFLGVDSSRGGGGGGWEDRRDGFLGVDRLGGGGGGGWEDIFITVADDVSEAGCS